MENNKKIIITVLSVLVVAMAVGYALFAQELTINGSASIDSTWKVEITNITSKDVVGGAVNKTDPTYTATTANFSVGLTQPGDSITYDITVTNKGTLDAVVESITVNKGDNPAIIYTTSGLKRGDKLTKNNGTNTLTIKVDYDSSVTSQPTSTTNDITVTINYQQDLGQVVVENNVYAFHTTNLKANATYTYLQTIMTNENRQLYQDGTELAQVHPYYLKYTIAGDEITKRYVCFIADNTEHCMQGADGGVAYQDNVLVLQGVQNWFTSNGGSCNINASGNYSRCGGAGFDYVRAFSYGYVDAYGVDDGSCRVNDNGYSRCNE